MGKRCWFGLGFSIVIDEKESKLNDNDGTFGCSGMTGTLFSVDPEKN